MFSRKSETEKRFDRLEAEASAVLDRLLYKKTEDLTDDDKTELAAAGLFGGSMRIKCLVKTLEIGEQRRQSEKLSDRFRCAIGFATPGPWDAEVQRAVKEDILRDYDAYQAKLAQLRQMGLDRASIAAEALRFAEELKNADTLQKDLTVKKPLSLKPAKKSF